MSVFAGLFVMFFGSMALADDCSQVVSDKTLPTGERQFQGSLFTDDGNYTAVGLLLDQGQPALQAMFVQTGQVMTHLPAGTKLTASLQDGTQLTLVTTASAPAVASPSAAIGVYTQWKVQALLSTDDLVRLRNSPLLGLQVDFLGRQLGIALEKKQYVKQWATLTQCFVP